MPDSPPPDTRLWRTVGPTLAGALAPIVLAGAGQARLQPALVASAVVAALGAWLWSRERRRLPAMLRPAPGAPTGPSPTPPFAAMIDRLGDPILLVQGGVREDPSGRRFVFANAAARSLLRVQRAEGALATVIRDPEVLDAVEEALYGGLDREAPYEMRGVQDRVWRAHALALSTGEGRPPLALLVLRDETEIRRTERTRADFLANASHELRTPLASLSGFIETLRGHARDDAEARDRFLAIMQVQAERMRRLIDDLMSLSRIELGEHIPPAGEVDIAVAVIDVIDALAPLARERAVGFETLLAPRGAAIAAADRDQILQVIQNLTENAVKYSPAEGCVTVQVETDLSYAAASARTSDLPGHFALLTPDHPTDRRYVAIRVRDFGAGIERIHLPRLTERFYRVEGGKTRERPGTGLGLAIVKHIINRHRGGLIIESGPGAGTLFCAYVPMILTPPPAPPAEPAEAALAPGA